MKEKLQDLIADALYPTSSNDLPSECARLGLAPGQPSEAFSGKRKYVTKRLDNLSAAEMIDIAKRVVNEHPSDELQTAIERLDDSAGLVSSITRHKLAEALDKFTLSGKYSLIEMLAKHWPSFRQSVHLNDLGKSLGFLGISDFIDSSNPDLDQANSEILKQVGFFNCSQSRLFEFLEDIVDPSRRDYVDQQRIVNQLNPILERDAYSFIHDDDVSGYPLFHVCKRLDSNTHPGRESISRRLIQYDEFGVYDAWQKALDRKDKDPKGAITAAKSLLETVCKQIIEEAGSKYSDRDDLPRLYSKMAECLKLAPTQHTEPVFKNILGNCQSVVGNLAAIRNKLGDAHGQGRRQVRPRPRHAELAVNLAGSMAMFLISTWSERRQTKTARD